MTATTESGKPVVTIGPHESEMMELIKGLLTGQRTLDLAEAGVLENADTETAEYYKQYAMNRLIVLSRTLDFLEFGTRG